MIITKMCYDCEDSFDMPESELYDGLVARPIDGNKKKCVKIWLCEECRQDAEDGGEVDEEDVDIVEDFDDNSTEIDP